MSAGTLFYTVVGVQLALGFVLTNTSMLHASLAVSCTMMAFVASRPHADIPMLLTLPVFVAGFVLTLVSAQVSVFRKQVGAATYVSPRRTWLGVSGLVVGCTAVLGLALLLITPFPGPGPLQWKLDKGYLAQHNLTGQPAMQPEQGGTAQTTEGRGATPIESAVQVFKAQLRQAETVADAVSAVGAGLKQLGLSAINAYPWWWAWLILLWALAVAAHPRIRLWLRTRVDWAHIRLRKAHFERASTAPAVRLAWERLLDSRGLPRLPSQTLAQHAGQAKGTADTRVLLAGFAAVCEARAYGVPTEARHSLAAIYLKGFSVVSRERTPHAR